MFSNLSQNSIIYVMNLNNNPKILNGTVERVSIPRPKYSTFNPTMEMVVNITAIINGERREFKGVPNGAIADFGEDAFVLAENKEALNSYISAMIQNSRNIIDSYEKHQKRLANYEEAQQELNPEILANREKDKAIQSLQDQVETLKKGMEQMLAIMTKGDNKKL